MKLRKLLALPATAALLLTAACGSTEPPAPTDQGGGNAPEESGIGAVDLNAVPREELQQGGTLRIPVTEFVYWNPFNVNGNEADYADISEALFPNLFVVPDSGEPEPNPLYLESAELSSEDPTVVNFTLNPAAVWNDGEPLGVDDFQAMWQACNGENTEFQCATNQGYDQIESIEQGATEQEVVVTFSGPYPDWTQPFSQLFRAESLADPATFNEGWSDVTQIGDWMSGPFEVGSYDETQQVLTLVPNDTWWGDAPLLDEVQIRVISADAQANAYINGELDSFEIGPDPDAFQKASGYAEGDVRSALGPNFRHFTFNHEAGVLTDQAVRQAIVMGLDRQAIGQSDMAGIDVPVQPLNNNIFLASQEQFVDMAAETGIDYNPDAARQKLEEAGWTLPEGATVREKDGEPLEVDFSQIVGVPVSENEALQAQAQLAEIGVQVNIVDATQDNWIDRLTAGEFEIFAFSWIGTPYPYQFRQIYVTGGESNFGHLSNERIDELADLVDTTVDPTERTTLANEAARLMWEEVSTLPLYQRPEIVAARSNLANYGAFGLNTIRWENVGFQA
ncbi:ABC transporter family substrate-binding protein [Desertihabitans brevis]|uniref:ABC transporter family substrate-binding protein n=1 Tax=Desertihabitans brevis TaxID=2268447 RepID=A0A367YVK3_9ACTN|nr:ABC transporter family substrate-binding protein [Desertihabitans brevis]RCK69916.1 ABC transporter family substrate-binding protein [Desertihabitans brevis]